MKKKLLKSAFAVSCLFVVGMVGNSYHHANSSSPVLLTDDVEALTACESIGWWDNDGNCVNNGKGAYFCKTDSWHELTDCKI